MGAPYAEFAGNKRLLWIAEEWKRSADDLADWAMERLVNRRDVWSQYTLKAGEIRVVMLPIKERRKLGTDMVTHEKLKRHFTGRSPAHLIGLHSISDHSTCKWFAIDIDLHDEKVLNADEIATANLAAALEWSARLQEVGFDPMLMDSNGAGGYHVWVLLDKEYPLADVYDYVNEVRSDYAELGLPRKPEVFPPKRAVEPDDLPYTLRLAGRHHTRHHYTRIRNFEPAAEIEWLDGGDAIEAMIAARPSPLPVALKKATLTEVVKKAKAEKKRTRVCVDLDGVLARYDSWQGSDQIGSPVEGAREFALALAEIAEIVVFTSRCSQDPGDIGVISRASTGQRRIQVISWLEKNKIPFSDVYVGEGKPRAAAFIDDRAVACRPQENPSAFDDALVSVRSLVRGPAKTKAKAKAKTKAK